MKRSRQDFSCDESSREKSRKLHHNESFSEMETFYKEKLHAARFALKQKEEELKSLKDRLAAEISVSIKTGDMENMNNPVSKTKLTEMYNKLKLLQWPRIKDDLKSNKMSINVTKDLIQKVFVDAKKEMQKKKKQIEDMFGLIEPTTGVIPQKVKEYNLLTIQNLQMALFHSTKEDVLKEDVLKTPLPDDQYPQGVESSVKCLASECYWLGCLMALNNPPLQPDWKNHSPSSDAWDIFPQEITSAVVM